jgi:hypothetical protein
MGLEHFIAGASSAREPEHHMVDFLEHKDWVHSLDSQANRLYIAEGRYRERSPESFKTISPNSARNMIGEIIHHPGLDDLPGINELRQSFNPETDTRFTRDLNVKTQGGAIVKARGAVGKQTGLMSFATNRDDPLRVNTVTHETAHKLLINAAQLGHVPLTIAHSWPMARLHVSVIRKMFGGKAASQLKEHYGNMGVDFGNSKI